MCVALVIQHAKRMRRIIFPYGARPVVPFFSTLFHKQHDFRENVTEHKTCFDFLYNVCMKYLILTRVKRDMYILVFMQSTRYSAQILMKLEFSRQSFEKYSNINFHKNPSGGGERFVPCGRTDMKIIVDFWNFANTPENTRVISGFRSDVDENCALLGYYAASSGNSLPTFRDNLSIPSSRVENGCHATSVRNYLYSMRNNPEKRSCHAWIHIAALHIPPSDPLPRHFSFLLGAPWSIQNTTYHLTKKNHTMCNAAFIHCGLHFSRDLFLPKARLKLQ